MFTLHDTTVLFLNRGRMTNHLTIAHNITRYNMLNNNYRRLLDFDLPVLVGRRYSVEPEVPETYFVDDFVTCSVDTAKCF